MFVLVDRYNAGEQLAAKLLRERWIKKVRKDELLVLSIPRGGVVVGAAIAQHLRCVHEIVAVKKIGFPGQQELAIGAIAEDGAIALSWHIAIRFSQPTEEDNDYLTQTIEGVKTQIETYIQKFRQGRTLDLQSKTVIIVDDGIATGETMKAAVLWSRAQLAKKVIVAAPVASSRAAKELQKLVDKFIYLAVPKHFWGVGQFYCYFEQVSDEEVLAYLLESRTSLTPPQPEPGVSNL